MELGALGTRIGVDTSCLAPDERAHLHRLWERCLTDGHPSPEGPSIKLVRERHDSEDASLQLLVGEDWDAFPYKLSGAVTMDALTQRVGTDLLFHAAGLADEAGRVIVLVAASGMGKTTAARTLGTTLGYVSDESVAIRRDGTVGAYPKPLSLVHGENQARKIEVSPSEAGLRRHPDTLVFSRLVLLVRVPDLDGPSVVEELDLLDAAVQATEQTSGLAKLEAPLDWLARCLATGGEPVALKYREIEDGADLIRDLLAETSPTTAVWTHHPSGGELPPSPGGWARSPYLDAIESSERVLVLTEHGVILLAGIGALAWLAAEISVTREAILGQALAEYGPHPDAEIILDSALAQLVEKRLLRTV